MRAGAEAFVCEPVAAPGLTAQGRGSPESGVTELGSGSAAPQMFVGAWPPPMQGAWSPQKLVKAWTQQMLWKAVHHGGHEGVRETREASIGGLHWK
eukprot:11800980-Alexandrium_andersonii.AAC.1